MFHKREYIIIITYIVLLLFQFLGSRESKEIHIEKETEKALIEMEKFIYLNKNTIIGYLIDQVFTIDCSVHENFKLDEF